MRHYISTIAMAVAFSAAVLQTQAQGIYVHKKNGETVTYPAAIFDQVAPMKITTSVETTESGVVTTLQYEKIADMNKPRVLHQSFAVGDALVVVGGVSTDFYDTKTAEIYQNGQWRDVSIRSAHTTGFTVTLSDGRIMVGGGSDDDWNNWSTKTDIFDPATMSFTPGPDMTVGRAHCQAINTPSGVYVSGNYLSDDKVLDCLDGSTFKAVGDMDGRYCPYLFTDSKGNVYPLSPYDNNGEVIAKVADKNGVVCLRGDKYEPSTGKTYYRYYHAYEKYTPVALPPYARPESSLRKDRNGYFVLAKNDADGSYLLTEPCPDESTTYNHIHLDIPEKHPVTGAEILWEIVFVNNAKNEAYILGFSGTDTEQSVHIISYNYITEGWTIATADGFKFNSISGLMSGSWTMLNDGRLACTGAGTGDTDHPDKCAYIFTPASAGTSESSSSVAYGVNVYKTDGSKDTYMESELESITTYMEQFDERITQEIPVEYLSKISQHMPIYSGNTPPNIEGTYLISPDALAYTSIENDYEIGTEFMDRIIRYSAQDMTANTVTYEDEEVYDGKVYQYSMTAEAKVLGKGDNFTIFVITESKSNDGHWSKTATIYSGTMTSDGIKDCFWGFVMLDNDDDDDSNDKRFISVGSFRIFKDKDGLSVPTTWLTEMAAARAWGAQSIKLPLPTQKRMR